MASLVNVSTLSEGDEFSSFDILQEAIRRTEREQNITYWKRHCRTIESCQRRRQRRLNPALVYSEVHWACVRGGRLYESRSKGHRPNQKTYKEGCGACVKVCTSRDGEKLVVTKSNFVHNHATDEETFKCLPKQRRLDVNEVSDLQKILQTCPSKTLLLDYVRKTTGKPVTLRDIGNLTATLHSKPSNHQKIHNDANMDDADMVGLKWMTSIQRKTCLKEIETLLPLVGRLIVNSEDMDLFVLNYYLQDFVERNSTTFHTRDIPREKRKMSPLCNLERVIKQLATRKNKRIDPKVEVEEISDTLEMEIVKEDDSDSLSHLTSF